jgi:Domain of Unknown Function (DUF1080)
MARPARNHPPRSRRSVHGRSRQLDHRQRRQVPQRQQRIRRRACAVPRHRLGKPLADRTNARPTHRPSDHQREGTGRVHGVVPEPRRLDDGRRPRHQPRHANVRLDSGASRRLWPLLVYTKQQFGDFSLWLEWRETASGDNSGVYIRIPDPASADALHQADLQGHEVQIDDLGAGTPPGEGIHRTGAIYGLQAPTSIPIAPVGDWNTYLIEAAGSQIRVTLNGQLINDYTSNWERSGFLALQVHGFPSQIAFRNLRIKT